MKKAKLTGTITSEDFSWKDSIPKSVRTIATSRFYEGPKPNEKSNGNTVI